MSLKPIAERVYEENTAPSNARMRGFLTGLGLALVLTGGAVGAGIVFFKDQLRAAFLQTLDPENAMANNADSSVFGQHATNAGVKRCSGLFDNMGQSLVGNSEHAAVSNWDENDPDGHAIWSVVGMRFTGSEGSQPAGGLIFAAPSAGEGCEAVLTRIVPSQASCDEVSRHLPEGSSRMTSLHGSEVFRIPSGGASLLVPSETGCVIVNAVTGRL